MINSRKPEDIKKIAGSLDLLLVTVNVPLDWTAMLAALRPKGRLHFVGAVLEAVPINAFDIIMTQRSVSGSPNGSPLTVMQMLDFAARHRVSPQTQHFPIAKVNDAIQYLLNGKARYRLVLDMS